MDATDVVQQVETHERGRILYERHLEEARGDEIYDPLNDPNILDAHPEYASLPFKIRGALALEEYMMQVPIRLAPYQLLAGDIPINANGRGKRFLDYRTPDEVQKEVRYKNNFHWGGHHTPDYAWLLREGTSGLEARMAAKLSDGANLSEDQRTYWTSLGIALRALNRYARRYVELADLLIADESLDPRQRDEYKLIRENCLRVPLHPAETFHQAAQAYWFYYCAMCLETDANALGRFDRILWPYLQRDIEEARITEERAQEIVDCFFLKCAERIRFGLSHFRQPNYHLWHDDVNSPTFANHFWLNVVVGGRIASGEDGTNPLTYMALRTVRRFPTIVPILSARLHRESPPELFEEVARTLKVGGNLPNIYNDDVLVPAKTALGMPYEDAAEYSNDGCWENITPGKCFFNWTGVHLLQVLEKMAEAILSEAENGGQQHQYDEFEGFFQDYLARVKEQVTVEVEDSLRSEARKPSLNRRFLEILTHDCIERGADLNGGGPVYRLIHPVVHGLANAADSLVAIKRVVFDEKQRDLVGFLRSVRNEYKDDERLGRHVVHRLPKYGNDNDEVDAIARRIALACTEQARECSESTPEYVYVLCCIGTFENYINLGQIVGASPDGRAAAAPIASNANPALGRDLEGLVPLVQSYMKLPLAECPGGAMLDIRMSGEAGGADARDSLARLQGFIRAFIEMGGNMLTISTASAETLRQAQKEPEKHLNLLVRLGGSQAMFVTLTPEHQEHIIQRTEYGL